MRVRKVRRPALYLFAVLCPLSSVYAADPLEPGLWKVVGSVNVNGMESPAETKTRCLDAEAARDLERSFVPEFRVRGLTCERTSLAWSGQKLSWRIQCTGPFSMEMDGAYEFDTPRHYSGVITTLQSAGGNEARTRTTLEAERIGECAPEGGK
ncbi:MAG TPA: DUF3617 family protein [Xanthobacteraceae bacterium]|jgi:hypothetical protein|nr:DUF3617 family protein [Xanthobacteraceae bacterium]